MFVTGAYPAEEVVIRKSCGGKECHWQKALQNDGHCRSSSPPGTKRPMGLQSHQAHPITLAILPCLITAH